MLDQLSRLVDSIPGDRISELLDESFKAFNGAGPDLRVAGRLRGHADRTASTVSRIRPRSLIDDSGPLLESQAETADPIRTWARSLAGVTEQLAQNDPEIRAVLQKGPGFAQEVSSLLDQVKPTLPILLANLTTISQILVTYNPSLEQLLVIFPGIIAAQQSFGLPKNNPTGLPSGDFALTINDPPPCTVGFLPPSQWRNPADEEVIDTPDGLYCKLPQDSPLSVRGARNYPCIGHPGKRAPTVELCNDPRGYQPTAIRQHVLGAYPIDPNLVRRASRWTTASTSTSGSMRRLRARRCRRVQPRLRQHPTRCRRAHHRWVRCPGPRLPHRCPRLRPAAAGQLAQRCADTGGAACRTAARRRCGARCAKCVQRQRIRRTVGGGRALRPERALRHPPGHDGAADQLDRRRHVAQDVAGLDANLSSASLGAALESDWDQLIFSTRSGTLMNNGLLMPHEPLLLCVVTSPPRTLLALLVRPLGSLP